MNAKATPKDTTPSFDLASFALTPDFSVKMPEHIPAPTRATELPFKASFSANLAAAVEGKQPHFFVPDAFWKARTPDAKVDASYGRGKVRDAFNKWVKEDEKARSIIDIALVYREKGLLDAEGKPVEGAAPGLSYWLIRKS
jgi:hypothetical protein